MEINNVNLNQFCNEIFSLPAIAISYFKLGNEVEVSVCDPVYETLPIDLKLKTSFASFFLSSEEFENLTGIKL